MMRKQKINLVKCLFKQDADCSYIAFESDERGYFLVSRANEFDDQDRDLGMDETHYELNDQSQSCYGGVVAALLSNSSLILKFKETHALKIGAAEIEVFAPAEGWSQSVKSNLPVLIHALKQDRTDDV